ncbi:MAG: 1-deoxy-D-xylulose-5-phosphate reductoisomerase [Desulfobacteraceae bacterium]|nr:1-deoxy-D-xylulose-5-phosphate reductoisomerase [Desulfobacteraceae bacterium]
MKSLAVLGSTGSIGQNTLKIAEKFPEKFNIKVLTAKENIDLLARQILTFRPEMAAVYGQQTAQRLKERLPSDIKTQILYGPQGYQTAAKWDGVEMVVCAMVGAAGLKPTLAAIESGKDIALANKETLVMAGNIVIESVLRNNVNLLPIDSEHSAIFQCLQGNQKNDVSKIILTASGGPFRETPKEAFATIRASQALKHPNWQMGAKISIDSATLMNKGLEVIEAKWLFGLDIDQIQVVVHPQSIVHSMVAYCDGSVIAQLGVPDMTGAIAYALSYPNRLALDQPLPDLPNIHALTFDLPDLDRFPCLKLAFEACKTGGTLAAVMNAANEIAVDAFLNARLPFTDIYKIIEHTMAAHDVKAAKTLEEILEADDWSRRMAVSRIGS